MTRVEILLFFSVSLCDTSVSSVVNLLRSTKLRCDNLIRIEFNITDR